ncbi:hypothetical protein Csa_006487 [Cucumis sativus]|nr:hypothetical protein Csa_006487 [Cucumis sativus]
MEQPKKPWSITETLDGSKELGLKLDAAEMLFESSFLLNYFPEQTGKAKITMFDVVSEKSFKATMERKSASNQFLITWKKDFVKNINYKNGDEILLYWEPQIKSLCFEIVKCSALRTYPQMSGQYRSYNYSS